jgi:hypothetical protein
LSVWRGSCNWEKGSVESALRFIHSGYAELAEITGYLKKSGT